MTGISNRHFHCRASISSLVVSACCACTVQYSIYYMYYIHAVPVRYCTVHPSACNRFNRFPALSCVRRCFRQHYFPVVAMGRARLADCVHEDAVFSSVGGWPPLIRRAIYHVLHVVDSTCCHLIPSCHSQAPCRTAVYLYSICRQDHRPLPLPLRLPVCMSRPPLLPAADMI
jgi:hypothetical protein